MSLNDSGKDGIPSSGDLVNLTHELRERVKELSCLYAISRLVDKGDSSLEDILQGTADLIPGSWQYPEIACARIKLPKRKFATADCRETPWTQQEIIVVNKRPYGRVEVFYTEERPAADEGPFLAEERALLRAIAERLGRIIERWQALERLDALYKREHTLRQKLQAEARSKVDFTRNLIHELKTPLTSLLATSQLLRDETRGSRLEKLSGYIWESAHSLADRVDELHDLVKGEVGTLELERRPLDVVDLLSTIVDATRAHADKHDVAIHLEAQEPLPRVHADATRVRQIVDNLLNNAFKYGGQGGVVTIRARNSQSAVTIEVQDAGSGIPVSEQRRIFEPYHGAAKTGRHPRGLGLGLALCKMLVEIHGGRIWVESRPRRGSTFFFTLPALNGEDHQPRERQAGQ